MDPAYLIHSAFQSLRKRARQSKIVIAGYALSVLAMIVLVSLIKHSGLAKDQVLKSTGTHFIAFIPARIVGTGASQDTGPDRMRDGFYLNGVPTAPFSMDILKELSVIPEIKDTSPVLVFQISLEELGSVSISGVALGRNEAVNTNLCAENDLIAGRFLAPEDRGRFLAEEGFARSAGLIVGDNIIIGSRDYSICGIVNSGVRPVKVDAFFNFADAEEIARGRMRPPPAQDSVNVILVEVKDARYQQQAISAVRRIIPDALISSYACSKPAAAVMAMNRYSSWALIGVIGLAAVLIAMKSQAASVSERRRDFAILKLIGWSRPDIAALVVSESAISATAGGFLGCALSCLALLFFPCSMIGTSGMGIPVSLPLLVLAFFLALLSGIFAGIPPAIQATRIIPVRALAKV